MTLQACTVDPTYAPTQQLTLHNDTGAIVTAWGLCVSAGSGAAPPSPPHRWSHRANVRGSVSARLARRQVEEVAALVVAMAARARSRAARECARMKAAFFQMMPSR